MKTSAKIAVRRFVCQEGRIQAEGKAAMPPFCYRVKVIGGNRRKTVIELHSKVTGRKIGYIGKTPGQPLSPSRSGAKEWEESPGKKFNTPEAVQKKMKHFLDTAQNPGFDPKATEHYRKLSSEAWKKIVREARRK